jgi:hypothetical protein
LDNVTRDFLRRKNLATAGLGRSLSKTGPETARKVSREARISFSIDHRWQAMEPRLRLGGLVPELHESVEAI